MAEAANEAHAVELAGLFLEPADQQHFAVGLTLDILAEVGNSGGRGTNRCAAIAMRKLSGRHEASYPGMQPVPA